MKQSPSLQKLAINVVNMFDQANTSGQVQGLGTRGVILKEAVEELRAKLNQKEVHTILTAEQAKQYL